ncbi:MAG: aldehyde dehydrogenase family protein, partial [Actinobacteria bacterium]|nr:aldehyde dehydrogenase family protein [Actinomycetota bacterium]
MNEIDHKDYIAGLIQKAREAQKIAESFTQDYVDKLAAALAWTAVKEENVLKIAQLAFEESKMGNFESKCGKLRKKPRGVLRDLKEEKSVGVIEVNKEKGLLKIAKPVGVIGALVPCTNPEVTPVIKGMCAVKGRNAVVFCPHPRTKNTTLQMVKLLRETLKKLGAPENLLICAENPSIDMSMELMKQCDLVIATGGAAMVKSAYSSGTPAYGVGAGNAVVVIDETADIKDAAHKIILSKTNDFAS